MKVANISGVTFRSNPSANNAPFLYTANENYSPKYSFKENRAEYIGGFLALGAAIFALSRFVGRNTIPKSIVELADKSLGLNKIKSSKRTTAQLKEKILYPIMCADRGIKQVFKGDFKTGLIIGGKNQEKLTEFVGGFMEHAKELGIHCVELKSPNKTNRLKEVHKALDKAIQYHNETGKCVIVNIGDLGAVSKLKVAKTNYASNIEERLAHMPKGILWTAHTTETSNLPYFYNNLPTLNVKI